MLAQCKVTVTASYSGPSGSLWTFDKVELSRVGDPYNLDHAGTYVVRPAGSRANRMKSDDGCPERLWLTWIRYRAR